MDDKEFFNYDNSENDELQEFESNEDALDLNSFSSGAAKLNSGKVKTKGPKSKKEKIIRIAVITFLCMVISVCIAVGGFFAFVFATVDGTMEENLNDLKLNFTTTIYYENESGQMTEYQRLHGMYNRIWVNYDRNAIENKDPEYKGIPQNLVDAFVAIEDKRFFEHEGVDWRRTISAFVNMFLNYDDKFGGSTITQQLVKNLTGDNEDAASRKIREIMRARFLETNYHKDTIIECYLNTIPMGHGIYGVEVAANFYFDKSVHELTLAECASLAGITNNPSKYVPDDQPEYNKERQETTLALMLAQGYITQEEHDNAVKEKLNVTASRETLNEEEINNYYVEALIRQVTKDLADKYGYTIERASANFYNGGYKIYATVNPKYQEIIDKVYSDSETYGLKHSDGSVLQGSFTIMDYNGNVLGMAGAIGEKKVNLGYSGFNRATDAIRQPGSTMKPLAAYAPAIENNIINFSSMLNDTSTNYNGWQPKNWYKYYYGNITTQYALERSVNTIPVYLVNKMGGQSSFDFITKKLGVSTLTSEDIYLSPMGLGGTNGGFTTLQSAAAYAIFGNGGIYYEPILYTEVLNQHGEVVLKAEDITKRSNMAISENTATVMNHLLQSVVYGSEGTGKQAASFIPNMKIYAKTGTSNDENDLWFVGGTPYYVASAWCGYDSMKSISKTDIARRMWGAVMSEIHKDLPVKSFTNSKYATCQYFCKETGQLATSSCPKANIGWYKKDALPPVCKTHVGTILDSPEIVEEDKTSEGNNANQDNTVETPPSDTTESKPNEESTTE